MKLAEIEVQVMKLSEEELFSEIRASQIR